MESNFGHWLAGFLDGEGCFGIQKCSQTKKVTYNYFCRLQIDLRDDDLDILYAIRDETGVGHVTRSGQSGTSKPQGSWIVSSKSDCLAMVRLLDEFPLRAKKARDYAIWREAVLLWNTAYKTGVVTPADWTPMADLKSRLTESKVYSLTI